MKTTPAIVVITYNRSNSLVQLLNSIKKADYNNVPTLIISIDYSEDHQQKMFEIAEQFDWEGEKIVIARHENLGLKAHIFTCAEYANEYDSIVMLEDDLIVSPAFYTYSLRALEATQDAQHIAGVALYRNSFNESVFLPFEPITAESDFFLMQTPCSWGQIWTKKQWNSFLNWYTTSFSETQYDSLPAGIAAWSEKSWKKPFYIYLHQTNTYFAYPYISYSMNRGEPGTNMEHKDNKYVNSLALSILNKPLQLHADAPIYSGAFCLQAEYLKKHNTLLKEFDFTVDFYGDQLQNINENTWVLTCLPARNAQISFGLELKPIEMNILLKMQGNDIKLVRKKDILSSQLPKHLLLYFYSIPNWYIPYFQDPILKSAKDKLSYTLGKIIPKK